MREDFWGMKCHHPDIPLDDLATGARQYASIVRRHNPKCGADAKLFEVRPPAPSPVSLANRIFKFLWRLFHAQI